MHEGFWFLFIRTGDINAYLAYKGLLEINKDEESEDCANNALTEEQWQL